MSNLELPYREGMDRHKIGRDARVERVLTDCDDHWAMGLGVIGSAGVGVVVMLIIAAIIGDLMLAVIGSGAASAFSAVYGLLVGIGIKELWLYRCRRAGRLLVLPEVVIEIYDEQLEGTGVDARTARASLVENFSTLERLLEDYGDSIDRMPEADEEGVQLVRQRIDDALTPIALEAMETHETAINAASAQAAGVTAGLKAMASITSPSS
jgi:hypothetical protein